MNKNKTGRKFGRKADQRRALLKSLANAFVLHEKICTTEPKAKALRSFIEPIVRMAKTNTIAKRRHVIARLGPQAAKKLFSEVAPRYKARSSGFTRIVKKTPRKSDFAKMAVIEFL